jgi:hypothetical protein
MAQLDGQVSSFQRTSAICNQDYGHGVVQTQHVTPSLTWFRVTRQFIGTVEDIRE